VAEFTDVLERWREKSSKVFKTAGNYRVPTDRQLAGAGDVVARREMVETDRFRASAPGATVAMATVAAAAADWTIYQS